METSTKTAVNPLSAVLLGGGMISLPGRNFARFILMQFILFSLIVRTGYQGVQFEMMLKVSYHSKTN
jgi:hypothetical protein